MPDEFAAKYTHEFGWTGADNRDSVRHRYYHDAHFKSLCSGTSCQIFVTVLYSTYLLYTANTIGQTVLFITLFFFLGIKMAPYIIYPNSWWQLLTYILQACRIDCHQSSYVQVGLLPAISQLLLT